MSQPSSPPLLLDTIGVLLPSPRETLFLQACLGVRTEETWHLWQADEHALRSALASGNPAYKRLLPLLYDTLARSEVAMDADDLSALRLAAVWEERRAAKITSNLSHILQALAAEAIEPVVSKGSAIAHLAYPKPSLRHCHDIDLLLPAAQLKNAIALLESVGFSTDRQRGAGRATRVLVNEGGLPISLHIDLLPDDLPGADPTAVMERAHRVEIADLSSRVLGAADLLTLMAAQLVTGRARDRTSWAVDAALFLRNHGATESDWHDLVEMARPAGLSLALLPMLSYLRTELDIAVPDHVLAQLAACASEESTPSRDRVLALVRANPTVRFTDMVNVSGWRSRLDMLRWVIAPSTDYLRDWCRRKGLPWSRAWYVARPFRRLKTLTTPSLTLGTSQRNRRVR